MKKRTILKSLLVLFPVLAVALATTTDSVTVFDTIAGQTQYLSYFDVLPVENLQLVTPLAALFSALSGILAAVYLARKKEGSLKFSGYAALVSAALAAIPIVVQGDILVIPNVALPIFMMLHYGAAYMLSKATSEQEEFSKQNRLKQR